jgi:peptide/nickel transport system permease protein
MMIPIILGISLIVLILIDLTPGDPARQIMGFSATEEQLDEFREVNGLNDPFLVRYVRFLYDAVRGDFGTSYVNHRTVRAELVARFPYTLFLAVISMVASLAAGIPLGIYAATHQYSWKDNAAIFISLFCVSMPSFWFSLILVQFFSVKLGWLPGAGIESWAGWLLPAVSLALGYTATIARQTRSDMLEVIRQDFIVTARAKGQTERKVLFRHALKNALIPVITIAGTMFGASLSGSLIAEVIFSIPGVGQYTLSALQNRDYPVIQGCVLILSVVFSVVILLIDIIFAFVDPRIRSQFMKKRSKKIKVAKEVC